MGIETFPKQEKKERSDEQKYKYLKNEKISRNDVEVEEFTRLCLSPEGTPMTIQSGDSQCGICSENYFWRYDSDNYNNNSLHYNKDSNITEEEIKKEWDELKNGLEKEYSGLKLELPKALPLPADLRKLLPENIDASYFNFNYDDEWVHTHFNELYKEIERGQFPLLGGDEGGAIYIEPSLNGDKVYFCGRGDMACYYYLDLNKE